MLYHVHNVSFVYYFDCNLLMLSCMATVNQVIPNLIWDDMDFLIIFLNNLPL